MDRRGGEGKRGREGRGKGPDVDSTSCMLSSQQRKTTKGYDASAPKLRRDKFFKHPLPRSSAVAVIADRTANGARYA